MEIHRPVMPVEALAQLEAARGGLFIDATLGLGGHSELILRAAPHNRVIGFDRDAEAIALAKERLSALETEVDKLLADHKVPAARATAIAGHVSTIARQSRGA